MANTAWVSEKDIFKRTLTLDHTQTGGADQTNFPVLVSMADPTLRNRLHGGHVSNYPSGFDIGFYTDTTLGTKLNWEIERYNAGTGELVAWVKLGTVSSSSNTTFVLSYGDPTIVTDQSNAAQTFSNSFVNVYHLKDGTTLNVNDSLAALNGTNNGATPAGGQIDGAASFVSASSQYIELSASNSSTAAFTWSAWVNAPSFPNAQYHTVIGRNNAGNTVPDYLYVNTAGKLSVFLQTSALLSYDGTGSHTLSTNTWYYLCVVYDSTNGLIGYVNAASDNTVGANGTASITAGDLRIGGDAKNTGRTWNGIIDEARIASVSRSASWITTEYNNQVTGSTFVTIGAET